MPKDRMVKRTCQHATDVADHSTWCQEMATIAIWCNDAGSIKVFQCAEHFDPTFEGWTLRGSMPYVETRAEGFRVKASWVYPPIV